MASLTEQQERVLAWLRAGKTLTPMEALEHIGCMRLAARIYDLRKAGWPIVTEEHSLGNGRKVARYYLQDSGSA